MLKGLRQQIQDIPNLLSLKPLKCPNLKIIFFNNEYSSTMNMNSLFNEYEHARIWAVKNDVTLFPTDDLPKHPPKYHCSWPQRDDLILYGTQTCSLNSTQSRMSQKAVIYVMGQFKYTNIYIYICHFFYHLSKHSSQTGQVFFQHKKKTPTESTKANTMADGPKQHQIMTIMTFWSFQETGSGNSSLQPIDLENDWAMIFDTITAAVGLKVFFLCWGPLDLKGPRFVLLVFGQGYKDYLGNSE